jgi:dTDP-glucose 4,6-dehydratase
MSGALVVTGGAGFIGCNFVRCALAHGAERVVVLDLLTYAGSLENLKDVLGDRVLLVRGDIADAELVRGVYREHRPRAVLNFAAETHVDRSIDTPRPFLDTNVAGTFELLEGARRHLAEADPRTRAAFRFLHVSTDEVYGSLGADGYFDETTPYAPNSPYSASKAAADHFVRAYHHTFGVPTLITNCSNNYGPFQFPEKLIPLMITQILAGRPLPVYGDGRNVRDWLHVEDHCRALDLILTQGRIGEVYNIGGHSERENLSIVRELCALIDQKVAATPSLRERFPKSPAARGAAAESLISLVTDRRGHDRRYAINGTKLERELGFRPRHQLTQGLRETVDWYLARQP